MANKPESLRLIALSAFASYARLGTSRAAAKELNCDATTVMRGVNELERWLRRVLVIRSSPCEITSDGRDLLEFANGVLNEIKDTAYENDLAKIRINTSGTVKLAGSVVDHGKVAEIGLKLVRKRALCSQLSKLKAPISGKDIVI